MEIRKSTVQDLPSILEILNYEIQHSTAVYDENIRSLEQLNAWFLEKNKTGFPVFVAEENQQILGYATFGTFRPHDGFRLTVEHSIYISKDFRGRGIGHLLMEQIMNSGRESGYHVMVAGIDANNVKSIQFHLEFDFVEVGRMKEVGQKFGAWLDLVFLQKLL
jgi:L-amino acid N-acyltransferase